MNLFTEAGKLQDQGAAFAVATLIDSQGSTPRATAKMIVKSDGAILGTIGGGLAEAYVIKEALAAIGQRRSKTVEYVLNSEAVDGIQMLCGGKITVFIEVVAPNPRIVMIGAGHVGMAVARLAEFLDYRLVIVDDREEFANPEKYPMAAEIYWHPEMAQAIAPVAIDRNTYVVIATKDADLSALRSVIGSPAAYVGMIGSKRKVGLVREQLQSEGVSPERLRAVHAPVGLDLGSETPEEIALSIMAEIMKVRNGKSGRSLSEAVNQTADPAPTL